MPKESHSKYAKDQLALHIADIGLHISNFVENGFGDGAHSYHEVAGMLYDQFRSILQAPAKRLRGSFVLRAYEMLSGKPYKKVLDAALAVEIVHAYILIIDDFQDKSLLRRGTTTVHEVFTQYHKDSLIGDDSHFGNSMAAIVGLLGSHIGSNVLLKMDFSSKIVHRALTSLNDSILVTAIGQARDIYNENVDDTTEEDILAVHKYKTANYTYYNPIKLGMILAGADDSEIEDIVGFTDPAGIAFQIQDDILGVFGDPEKTGKSNMDDFSEGKRTLLTVKAFEKASIIEKRVLRAALGNRNLHKKPVLFDNAREIIESTGSLDYSKKVATELVEKAKEHLHKKFAEKYNNDGFKFITGIADYMIERDL